MKLNFAKICRICLEINNGMVSILENDIRKKLMACAVIEVYVNDGLPEQICHSCADKLVTSFYFKEQCEKSDKLLREYREKSSEGLSKQEDNEVARQTDNNPSSFIFVDCNPSTDTDSENEPIMVDSPMELSPSPQEATSNIQSQHSQPDAEVNNKSSDVQMIQNKFQNNLLWTEKHVHVHGSITKSDHIGKAIGNTKSNFKEIHESNHGIGASSFKEKGTVKAKKEKKSLTCEICHKTLSCAASFRYHIKKHEQEKRFICEICNQSFLNSKTFTQHCVIHGFDKPFVCNICDKRFIAIGSLDAHIKKHDKEKDLACSMCDRSFICVADLNLHIVKHAKEKALLCTVCSKRFGTVDKLNKHMEKHSKEKDFTCLLCDRSFVTKDDLRDHCITHAQDKPFGCDKCDKRFSVVTNLNKHVKTHVSE